MRKRRPAFQRAASSGVQASPAVPTVSRLGRASGDSGASAVGVAVMAVMRCSSRVCWSGGPGSSDSGGARTSSAPMSSVEKTSQTEASKPRAPTCNTRLPLRRFNAAPAARAVAVKSAA